MIKIVIGCIIVSIIMLQGCSTQPVEFLYGDIYEIDTGYIHNHDSIRSASKRDLGNLRIIMYDTTVYYRKDGINQSEYHDWLTIYIYGDGWYTQEEVRSFAAKHKDKKVTFVRDSYGYVQNMSVV